MNEKFEQLPEDEKELVEKITDALIESRKKKIDMVELAMKVQPYLKNGIKYEELTFEQKKQAYKDIYGEEIEIVFDGYGYHGGGRPRKDTEARRMTISISGTPTEIDKLKELAKAEGKTVSRFVLDNLVK